MRLAVYSSCMYDVVRDMHESQSYPHMDHIIYETLPSVGYVALNDQDVYVAAGFLRLMEGSYAQIDTMVSNKAMPPAERNDALAMISERLIADARALDLKGILALTKDESIISRAETYGFRLSDQRLLVLPLR